MGSYVYRNTIITSMRPRRGRTCPIFTSINMSSHLGSDELKTLFHFHQSHKSIIKLILFVRLILFHLYRSPIEGF